MKTGDIVQVRRFDGVDHWLYAVVQDPAINQVQIQHPSNPEDGKVLLAAASDVRTKADLKTLIDQVTPIVTKAGQHGLAAKDIRQLAAIDGFWSSFLEPVDGKLTEHHSKHLSIQQATIHKTVVKHYQSMMKQLS